MPETVVPEGTDESSLYAVVPEQFVVTRDALVRRLRAGGDKADAARVAKLRRPPLTTWALNQVARGAPTLVQQLLDAGSVLRTAMEGALRGDASALREARAEERSAVDAIVNEAGRRLQAGGYSPTDVLNQRMAATLRAAIVDQSVADLLQQGVLDCDQEAPGFGMESLSAPLTLVPPAEDEVGGDETSGEDRQVPAEVADQLRRWQAAVEEADRLAAEARDLAAEADRLGGEADRLASEAKAARKQAEEARTRADAAREAADAQRGVADHLATVTST